MDRDHIALTLWVIGLCLSAQSVVKRMRRRGRGQSLIEAVWTPSRAQTAFYLGLALMVAGLVVLS